MRYLVFLLMNTALMTYKLSEPYLSDRFAEIKQFAYFFPEKIDDSLKSLFTDKELNQWNLIETKFKTLT